MTLATLLACGCTPRQQELTIPFVVEFGGQAIGCEQLESGVAMSDLRFYVSDPASGADSQAPLVFVPDDYWQQKDLALLDFEDGTANCENGTGETNTTLKVRVPVGAEDGLRFTIGVPFDRNHGDPLLADAPLGDAAMHWHWRSGYKFLRGGVKTPDDGFWIHVGSTACEGTVGNITGCGRPNRAVIELPNFRIGEDVVVVELSALVADGELDDATPTDCSSGPAETSCSSPFTALGVDFETGEPLDRQTVFRRREVR